MLPIIFPEYKGYEKHIEWLTGTAFDGVNAYYYLKYGKNFIADIKPEQYVTLTDSGSDMWEDHGEERDAYAFAVAERIWQYDVLRDTAVRLGYADSDIKEIRELCIKLMKEENTFLPLELLFSKDTEPGSAEVMMKAHKMLEWCFLHIGQNAELLPSYVFENKDAVRIMVSANGLLLQHAEKYKADHDIVMSAVSSCPSAAKYMDRSLWGDREIAKAAARNSRVHLIFSYDEFKQFNDDDEIVKIALEVNGANICYASERIRSDYDMAVIALTHQRHVYPDHVFDTLSPELRSRKDLALLRLDASAASLKGFPDELLDDDDIAMKLIENEEITYLIHKMTDRIQQKYYDRLPENVQRGIHRA